MVIPLPSAWRHCLAETTILAMDLEDFQILLTGLYPMFLMKTVYSVQGTVMC